MRVVDAEGEAVLLHTVGASHSEDSWVPREEAPEGAVEAWAAGRRPAAGGVFDSHALYRAPRLVCVCSHAVVLQASCLFLAASSSGKTGTGCPEPLAAVSWHLSPSMWTAL